MKLGRNDKCWCGSGRKYKQCHMNFDEKLDEYKREGALVPSHKIIKNKEQIEGIRESAKINIAVLDYIEQHIKAGISTEQIDRWVYDETKSRGGIPAPLNYEGYPKSVCTSVNEQVVHGIPSDKVVLKEGDIISVDSSIELNGWHSDSAYTFPVGEVNQEIMQLLRYPLQGTFPHG